MGNEILFIGQVTSIVTFILGLFFLYRLLVKNKEATIQQIKEHNEFLKEKINLAGSNILVENLEKRINAAENEINRLNNDKNINKKQIEERKKELEHMKEMYSRMQTMAAFSSGLTVVYFCPICDEATIEYGEAKVYFLKRDKDEFSVRYKCGYSILNGKLQTECEQKNLRN